MRHSSFTAFYDANVLYPAPLRDFLMHLALTGAYRARWSALVHDEWKRNLLANRSDLTQAQLDRTSALMDKAVPDALVTGYESLIEGLQLPDVDDRHVLAVAIILTEFDLSLIRSVAATPTASASPVRCACYAIEATRC
ncbi:hypothetical protein HNR39_002845 [Glaciimonas immobilis]|uniref:PIN domain-containing protein n=1 Tax=Glaciimonas immobilis TaxID=728004 RepID=A0A840RVT7_9BURK|nr:PIN domain-containing protein [Glaciimonas immobilis]MBB5200996.1 hypothetical protein [Glaciimonas immobilis]